MWSFLHSLNAEFKYKGGIKAIFSDLVPKKDQKNKKTNIK